MEKIAQQFICTILKFLLWLLLILLLLSQLGVEITGILEIINEILEGVNIVCFFFDTKIINENVTRDS